RKNKVNSSPVIELNIKKASPKAKVNKDASHNNNGQELMPPILEYIDANIIGRDTVFEGPYGSRQVVYCDYTASGKKPNTSNNTLESYPGLSSLSKSTYRVTCMHSMLIPTPLPQRRRDRPQSLEMMQELFHEKLRIEDRLNTVATQRQIIKSCVNAQEDDVVIFTGSGTTSAIHKLIHALQLQGGYSNRTVVFVGPFEHHSNILPWKEAGAQVVRIKDDEFGVVCMDMFESELKTYKKASYTMYAAFSAASNVTGILTDTVAVAEMCHKYGALSFWDYASAAPYLNIDLNPTETGYKDAVFLSPHKFVGGPGTPVEIPGVLIAKKRVFRNPVPGGGGGGTVVFVTRDTHMYLKDIESREEGGTPAIVESIRAGMVFQLKQSIGSQIIEAREEELCRKAFRVWNGNPCLTILGNSKAQRLAIFSFIIYHNDSGKLLHHNFVSTLLNDLYGIQARGGCACAGPYAMDLLGMSEDIGKKFQWFLQEYDGPGFTRVNLPYFMNDETIHFILEAVDMVATHGWKLLPQYRFDSRTGSWRHRQHTDTPSFSLHEISYDNDGILVSHADAEDLLDCTLEDIAHAATKIFEQASEVN
ncbi:hypothetical protein QZH41_016676, partial [Actinostola sp. cb2023]